MARVGSNTPSRGTCIARFVAALGVLASCASMREGDLPSAPSAVATRAAPAGSPQRDSDVIPVGDSPRRGSDDALVTVVEFADFECPYCGRVEPTLRALAAQYGADIRFVWKDSPLASHHRAPLAAEAAREAYAQRGSEGFFAMHDLLFANQQRIDLDDLVGHAEHLGLDVPRFRRALEQHVHADAVRADVALAAALHVSGTPAFAINGTWITGARPRREFVAAIDAVLARARTLAPRDTVYATMTLAPVPAPRPPERVYAVPASATAPTLGEPGAPVVIEMFSDFECAFCARVQPAIEALLARRAGRVLIHHRDYPLPFHPHAQLAAEAAREVYAQSGREAFVRFAATLYAHQDALERADLERYAVDVGVNMTRFRDALDRRTHAIEMRDDRAAADGAHVRFGTPAFFVNGRYRAGAMSAEDLIGLVDEAAAAASSAPP